MSRKNSQSTPACAATRTRRPLAAARFPRAAFSTPAPGSSLRRPSRGHPCASSAAASMTTSPFPFSAHSFTAAPSGLPHATHGEPLKSGLTAR